MRQMALPNFYFEGPTPLIVISSSMVLGHSSAIACNVLLPRTQNAGTFISLASWSRHCLSISRREPSQLHSEDDRASREDDGFSARARLVDKAGPLALEDFADLRERSPLPCFLRVGAALNTRYNR